MTSCTHSRGHRSGFFEGEDSHPNTLPRSFPRPYPSAPEGKAPRYILSHSTLSNTTRSTFPRVKVAATHVSMLLTQAIQSARSNSFSRDGYEFHHSRDGSDYDLRESSSSRQVQVPKKWVRGKLLGSGAFGQVRVATVLPVESDH